MWVNLNVCYYLENHRQQLIRAIGEVNVFSLEFACEYSTVGVPGFVQTSIFIDRQRMIHFYCIRRHRYFSRIIRHYRKIPWFKCPPPSYPRLDICHQPNSFDLMIKCTMWLVLKHQKSKSRKHLWLSSFLIIYWSCYRIISDVVWFWLNLIGFSQIHSVEDNSWCPHSKIADSIQYGGNVYLMDRITSIDSDS
jgi:hypothetical protein